MENKIKNIINNIVISFIFYQWLLQKKDKNTFIDFSTYIYKNFWVLELAKINDPESDKHKNKNISLKSLKNEDINKIILDNSYLFTKIRKIRNKLLSHNDFKEIINNWLSNNFTNDEIDKINEILEELYKILNPNTDYKIFKKSFSKSINQTNIQYVRKD